MLFSPFKLGPITLRNRSIRAAAFEGMAINHSVSSALIKYHQEVAKGEIGMTTVAYASVNKAGIAFPHQLLIRDEIIPNLRQLTDAVHHENAAASIQIGHCGNMAKRKHTGTRALSASNKMNWYVPSFPKKMTEAEIISVAKDYGNAVKIASESGFDAVEVHAGHGYLISQFLSPFTNKRKDNFGGSLINRMRMMEMVINEVLINAKGRTAVIVKMNMDDGFSSGMHIPETIEVAKKLESLGVHGLVLSGGFVSKSPMYVMRGEMPINQLANRMDNMMMKFFVNVLGERLVPSVSFKENYFLNDAIEFRKKLKLPLIYVGGILSKENIDEVLSHGFEGVAIARALINDPNFIKKIKLEENHHSACDTCNYCVASIYNSNFECIKNKNAFS